jgi:hypothetical protein
MHARVLDAVETGQGQADSIGDEMLQMYPAFQMATEDQEEVQRRVECKRNMIQMMVEQKLNFFGHICQMDNTWLTKQVVFGMMDGTRVRGRPSREGLDDIKEWCKLDMHSVRILAQTRTKRRFFVGCMVDTNGH